MVDGEDKGSVWSGKGRPARAIASLLELTLQGRSMTVSEKM
jgi:hypothetical protein